MELDKLETTILKDVQIKVDNWKWAKWVHLIKNKCLHPSIEFNNINWLR